MTQINQIQKKSSDAEKRIPDTSGLVEKTDYNAKISEKENKIPSISGLATTSALTEVENIIPDVSSLVKKAEYNAKITDIENEYITTADYNKFTKDVAASNI